MGLFLIAGVLVVAAVFLAFSAIVAARAREHAVLRAIGATPGYILAALWLELGIILTGAVVAGVALGWVLAAVAASALGRASGVLVTVSLGWEEALLAAAILGVGLVAAVVPALAAGRTPPGALLKR